MNDLIRYCLKDKFGLLFPTTLSTSQLGCWENGGFEIVVQAEGDNWGRKYWKREKASIASAKRLGWKFQRVKIVEVE